MELPPRSPCKVKSAQPESGRALTFEAVLAQGGNSDSEFRGLPGAAVRKASRGRITRKACDGPPTAGSGAAARQRCTTHFRQPRCLRLANPNRSGRAYELPCVTQCACAASWRAPRWGWEGGRALTGMAAGRFFAASAAVPGRLRVTMSCDLTDFRTSGGGG
ncbi:hypothetical protein HispidOSU_013407 [Sigmodon hispidus]